jgi:hypothetical protein
MRGRLIFPFRVRIAPIDTVAMAADPDGAGPLTEGYDPIFREPVKLPPVSGAGPGTTNRKEKTEVDLLAQIEPIFMDRLTMHVSGNVPDGKIQLIFHFRDLEGSSYVDVNGEPLIRVGDRLVAIYTTGGVLVQTIRPPLYVTEVRPIGFGLNLLGPSYRNLLLVVLDTRDTGTPE